MTTQQTDRDALRQDLRELIDLHSWAKEVVERADAMLGEMDAQAQRIAELSVARNKEAQETVAWMNQCDTLRAEIDALRGHEPDGWLVEYYCLPECATEMEWEEVVAYHKPDIDERTRNIRPFYLAPVAPAQPVQDTSSAIEKFKQLMQSSSPAELESARSVFCELLGLVPAQDVNAEQKPHYKLGECPDCCGEGESRKWGYDDYSSGFCHDCNGTGKVPVLVENKTLANAKAAQQKGQSQPAMICPKCKADRFKSACQGERADCPMTATAQGDQQ